MSDTKRVGIDLAKKIYHLTAVDESGAVVERKRLRRARQLAVKDRTAHANPLHGFLLEYGIESRIGIGALRRRLAEVLEDAENELPVEGRALLWDLGEELRRLRLAGCELPLFDPPAVRPSTRAYGSSLLSSARSNPSFRVSDHS